MRESITELAYESILDSYIFYNGDCSCDINTTCKFCNFEHELSQRLEVVGRYVKQLEAQISRDRESLIKEGEK